MADNDRLQVALSFAALGCRIYPAKRTTNQPMEKGWRKTATTDEATIRAWWQQYGGCNFGMLTDDDMVVLDLDVKGGKDGLAELVRLEAAHSALPTTHTDSTPSGGKHLIFLKPAGVVVKTVNPIPGAEGVELHGKGSSAILAGAFFPDGRQYTTTASAFYFAELPAWLLKLSRNGKDAVVKYDRSTSWGEDETRDSGDTGEDGDAAVWRAWLVKAFPEATWSGDEAQVCCPFHEDTTPSCSVNVQKEKFYCHASGCNAHGGLVRFAQRAIERGAEVTEELQNLMAGRMASSLGTRPTTAELLVGLCSDMELFSCDGLAYATLPVDHHHETWPLKTQTFRDILAHRFYLATQRVPSSEALEAAIGVLRGKALWEGAKIPVSVRLAGTDDRIYLDIGDTEWRCIEVTAAGWSIVDTPTEVRFRRPKGLQELPVPSHDGDMMDLLPFLNCATPEDEVLVLAWLVGTIRPGARYPVLGLNGEQGSGKSTVARRLRELVDPNMAMLRASPREEDDLLIAAHNGHLINLDNISHMQPWLSDAICRLSTGAGWAKRQLYADAEETIFQVSRPVIMNGIADLFHRGDLLDRSIIVTLPPIPEAARKMDKAMDDEFARRRPGILGGLLDVVSAAMRELPTTKVDNPPRMADWAQWGCAAALAMHTTPEQFLRVYRENRELGDQLVIEGSLVAQAAMTFMGREASGTWRGSAKALLDLLKLEISEETVKGKDWPKTGRGLSSELRRVAPALRKRGIDIQFEPREMDIRPIRITRRGGSSS